MAYAHRLMCYLTRKISIAEYEDSNVVVRHRCDNPPCVNPHHLLPGTHAENVEDRILRGGHVPFPQELIAELRAGEPAVVRRKEKKEVAKSEKARQKPIEPLSEQEIRNLIQAARPDTLTGARSRCAIALLAYAGLRIGEALALHPRDIDLEAGTVSVLRGKGHKQRVAALLPEGSIHVDRWLRCRALRGLNGSRPLLCAISSGGNVLAGAMEPGKALDRSQVHRTLQRLAVRAGIERRVHPHGLRHSHAHLLASRGKLITDIMQQLGHTNVATTSGYLDSFAPAGRVERLRKEGSPATSPALADALKALAALAPGDLARLADRLSNHAGEERGT